MTLSMRTLNYFGNLEGASSAQIKALQEQLNSMSRFAKSDRYVTNPSGKLTENDGFFTFMALGRLLSDVNKAGSKLTGKIPGVGSIIDKLGFLSSGINVLDKKLGDLPSPLSLVAKVPGISSSINGWRIVWLSSDLPGDYIPKYREKIVKVMEEVASLPTGVAQIVTEVTNFVKAGEKFGEMPVVAPTQTGQTGQTGNRPLTRSGKSGSKGQFIKMEQKKKEEKSVLPLVLVGGGAAVALLLALK